VSDVKPLRLMVFDATWARGSERSLMQSGLTSSWFAGGALYAALGRLDERTGATSWAQALDWLGSVQPGRPISEIQFWGHGRFGRAFIGSDVLDKDALVPTHRLHDALARVRDRLAPDALWWFRTCETFGTQAGHEFATSWTRFFRARAAGHTYVIGPWQSGLHSLAPGAVPTWSITEGLGDDVNRRSALMSSARAPHTITCLHGAVPAGW
jgi:hypothetical protein